MPHSWWAHPSFKRILFASLAFCRLSFSYLCHLVFDGVAKNNKKNHTSSTITANTWHNIRDVTIIKILGAGIVRQYGLWDTYAKL